MARSRSRGRSACNTLAHGRHLRHAIPSGYNTSHSSSEASISPHCLRPCSPRCRRTLWFGLPYAEMFRLTQMSWTFAGVTVRAILSPSAIPATFGYLLSIHRPPSTRYGTSVASQTFYRFQPRRIFCFSHVTEHSPLDTCHKHATLKKNICPICRRW